jgi:hypothetical protein
MRKESLNFCKVTSNKLNISFENKIEKQHKTPNSLFGINCNASQEAKNDSKRATTVATKT